jgi:hypothetical protein
MPKTFKHVYEFRVALREIRPPIWRRIQVPETYSFWDLHVAIQDAMGWLDYHLHEFRMRNPSVGTRVRIGIPDEDGWDDDDTLPGWGHKIAAYFTMENSRAKYLYDFGDDWMHEIRLERILPRNQEVLYPQCSGGRRACPPEECGGVHGYQEIVEGESAFQEHYIDYDPEFFDKNAVRFEDPGKRWRVAFLDEEWEYDSEETVPGT